MNVKKNIDYYLGLNWSYYIRQEEEDGKKFWIVSVKELPGVCTDGKTIDEAMENIKEALHAAIQLYIEFKEEIPEPINKDKFKGKIPYRTDSDFHYKLVMLATEKHMSLNKTIDSLLKESVKREALG